MENRIRVFIKTHKTGNSLDAFSCITVGQNDNTFTLYSKVDTDRKFTRHRIILEAICHYLNNIDEFQDNRSYKIVFYADSDEIAYEWQNEYLKEGAFADSTSDKDLFEKIIEQAQSLNVGIEIIGKNNVLSFMKKVV